MKDFESSIIIRLLCDEILRLEGQIPIPPTHTFSSKILKPTSNNVWKKLKRDKNGKFVKGRKK